MKKNYSTFAIDHSTFEKEHVSETQISDWSKQMAAFEWRDRKGEMHQVQDMDTKHLFFTLRMIWNHSAPITMVIHPYTRYDFEPYYTAGYMGAAVRVMFSELILRRDLTPYFKKCLKHMYSCCSDLHIKEIVIE